MQLVRTRSPVHALLPPVATVGRSHDADLVLTSDHASGHHAEVRCRGGQWTVRDLSSRNGTTLDGHPLHPRVAVPVQVGSVLQFGGPDEAWRVTGLHWPPVPTLFDPATGACTAAEDDVLGPLTYDLELDAWLLDGVPLPHGALVGDRRLVLPSAQDIAQTAPRPMSLDQGTLVLVPSADLERVEVRFDAAPAAVVFEDRVWGIILYVLATEGDRARTDGWVDIEHLGRRTGLRRRVLDVYVRRAREAFVAEGVIEGERLVEARRGVRRLGTTKVSVVHE